MKTKVNIWKVAVVLLVIVIACMVFFRGDIMDLIGESEVVVETLIEQDEELLKEVEEYRKTLPLLEAKVDSLEGVIEDDKHKIVEIHNTYEQKIEEIKNFTIEEDVRFYAEYLERDSIPKLLRLESKVIVAITPRDIKETNLIFLSHDAYVQERPLLMSTISNLELINIEKQAQIDTLSVVVKKQDERIEINKDIIVEKDKQISLYKKKGRRKMWSAIGVGVVAVAGTILIVK